MNSNNLHEISLVIKDLKDEGSVFQFLNEILTEKEMIVLSKRWRILKLLKQGYTQRQIAKELNVSLCKITRGAKILKAQNSIINRYL